VPVTASQLRDELRAAFRGRLIVDDPARGLYASDASLFHVRPLAVAVPEDEADLQTLVKYAFEHNLPLTPRGAGTGLSGEALGHGVVVDLSVRFRQILETGPDSVRVQPGVTYAELAAHLASTGRRFAPDPAQTAATVGGMVATNASGGLAYRHGYTADHVRSLRVVWDNAESSRVLRPSSFGSVNYPNDEGQRTKDVLEQTTTLLRENQDLIARHRPRTRFDRCGYALANALMANGADLVRLLVGSEGTLCFVTEATLSTVPLAGGSALAVLGFASIDAAVQAGLVLRTADGIAGCDLLDRRLIALAKADGLGPPPADVEAAVVVTVEADSERDAARCGWDAVRGVQAVVPAVVLAEPTCDPAGTARIRTFRGAAVGGLYALGRGPRPLAFCEDVGVPPEELPAALAGVQAILRKFDLSASTLVHVLTGVVHTRPLADPDSPADREKLYPVADAVHSLVLSLGGTVSAQHGVGLARTPWVEKQAGPLIAVYREVKRIFDPTGILNPGKIVGPDPSRPAWPLKEAINGSVSDASQTRAKPSLTVLTPDALTGELAKCNGCGECRPRSGPVRMCPVFRATGDEAASPRAKVNLLRELVAGEAAFTSDEVKGVADLCVDCRMCADECRAGVDVPGLVLEAKAAHIDEQGFTRGQWFLARAESLLALAGNFAFTANRFLGTRPGRWVLERVVGLSRHRSMPALTHRSFVRRARYLGLTRKPRQGKGPAPAGKLAYFVDPFTNWVDPTVGLAAVAVLKHHGYAVFVPARVRPTGAAALAQGDVDTARDYAARNVRRLAEVVRDGYQVVATDPTAALFLTRDYPRLLAGDADRKADADLVAAATVEFTAFLAGLHAAGELKPLTASLPVTLGHHVPCRMKALKQVHGPTLLGRIPGLTVRPIDVSCSGMAGAWGLSRKHYAASLAAGKPMLDKLNEPGILYGSTECGPCRMQMQEGTGKRALHPAQYLAYGYGLMPELEERLVRPLGKRITE
jgi:FAD/FMN-containing dehydrogenase/Fe-S oxidoreductase